MMTKALQTCLLILGILLSLPGFGAWGTKPLSVQKKEAKQKLEKRKKGFDQYLQRQQAREKKRLAKAQKMKVIRKAHAEAKEKARKNFVRNNEPFPKKAYKAFLKRREKREKSNETARKDYSVVQKELSEVVNNKKYRINGNKEFDLE